MGINNKDKLKVFYLLLMYIILFSPTIIISFKAYIYGEKELEKISYNIMQNASNDIEIMRNIGLWESNNLKYNTKSISFEPFFPFLLLRTRMADAKWTIFSRRGGCGEYATVCKELAETCGIPARLVRNQAEDHMWTEVQINGTWFHLDPLMPEEMRFNNPQFYEGKRPEGVVRKQISLVYCTEEDKIIDLTKNYTDTGIMTMRILKNGIPEEKVKIYIKSNYLMETRAGYKKPINCIKGETDKNGSFTFELGGNNYTALIQKNLLYGYNNKYVFKLQENHKQLLVINLYDKRLYLNEFDNSYISYSELIR